MNLYKSLIRPILFLFEPEKIHHIVFKWIKLFFRLPLITSIIRKIYVINDKQLHRDVFGIDFPNPIGLAAGFDKDARYFKELHAFGFGFIEIGTVTPMPQPGNDKPRMFRLSDDNGLINRMGFNNDGVEAVISRLKNNSDKIIIGGNIGKNKQTPIDKAVDDYEICFRKLFHHVDYFAINVSSPNTPGLRSLQDKKPLLEILQRLSQVNDELSSNIVAGLNCKRKPILLKISPDLSEQQLDEIIEVVLTSKIDGVIATNTTISRENLISKKQLTDEAGGLSGKPLSKRSTEVIRYLAQKSKNQFQIIAVGGIHSPEDAIEKLNAGADLIQLYTGFIYEGPGLVKRINKIIISR